jgi:ABC-type nitrate/sulfonate/bicarbonate transport system permease component
LSETSETQGIRNGGSATAMTAPPEKPPSEAVFRVVRLALVGLRKIALAALGVVGVVGLWWLIALGKISARLPSPPETIDAIRRDFTSIKALEYTLMTTGGIYQNLLYTFENGALIGFVIGVLIARIRIARDVLQAPLLVLGTVPIVMLLPFLTMWFGTARIAQNGLVIFYAVLTVTLVAQQATLNVSGRFEQYAASLGADQTHLLVRVILPAIIPEVLGAVRASLAAGWGFETVAEILGAPNGAGRLIMVFSWAVMTPDLLGVLICIGVLAVAVDAIVAAGGRWVVRWQE